MPRGVPVLALLLSLTALSGQSPKESEESVRKYIQLSEKQWAESLVNDDAGVPQRILADDYVGVAPNGDVMNKSEFLKIAASQPNRSLSEAPGSNSGRFLSNIIGQVNVRFYGDTAIAQGSESWTRIDTKRPKGKYVWMDTWIKRNGRWQIVASEDLIP